MGDPVLQYYESLQPEEQPKSIRVREAPLSAKLRCLRPTVLGIEIEAISDSGSQLISMNVLTAKKLGLNWDSRFSIEMQAANNETHWTLGLSRNVPFRFGNIVLYFQVHIMERAPYQVLLGRPFEVLAETVIASKKNGDTHITITDPYTGARATLPTVPRVRGCEHERDQKPAGTPASKPQDF